VSAVRIGPSILTADLGHLTDQVQAAAAAGADYLHLDVMDGHFVPVISFGPILISAVRKAVDLPLDVHLMIERPEQQIEAFRDAGADTLNVHVEATPHIHRLLGEIRRLGARAGVCINPGTAVETVEAVLADADQAIVMAVNPGWGGQSFIDSALAKIIRLRSEIDQAGLATEIEVDGGVNAATAPGCVAAGANALVAGSAVYNDLGSVADNLARLREAIRGA
jgi:ribulose-phosphate 3-epimerase